MKKAPRKLLALLLAVLMVFSVTAPAMATGTPPAGDDRVTEVTLPEQDWQMNRSFPKGTDDTLAINSIHSFNGYRDQGEIYVTLDERVESFRLFVNNVEISTEGMAGGKTYAVDIADIALDGTNSVQVTNIAPIGINGLVNVRAGYPVVIDGEPEEVGMDSGTLELVSDFLDASVKYGFSGAQIAVVKDGKLVMNEAYGNVNGWNADGTQIAEEDAVPVTTDTLYDLASNSKMYTANYAIQYLYDQGVINLNEKIADIFADSGIDFVADTIWIDYDMAAYDSAETLEEVQAWKAELTIKDILMHQAGFIPDPQYHNNYYDQATGALTDDPNANVLFSQDRETTLEIILKSPLAYEPGTKTAYSDVDYMLLAYIVEAITGMGFDEYLREIFWDPMGLENMTFNPLDNGWTVDDCAATELDGNKRADMMDLRTGGQGVVKFDNMREGVIQGTVHDEKCYYTMDGISGHAGLYANAEDLAKLASVMLTGGYGDNHYFKASTMEQFIEAKSLDYTQWGLGWWREGELSRKSYWTTQSSNETIGHQGWTGTLTMIDPEEDLVVVLLTNKKNSPILANEKGQNDFFSDNMLAGALNIAIGYVYDSLNSSPEAVDASVNQLFVERTWVASTHGGAYDEMPHMNDSFAMADLLITRAEKRPTEQNIAYARDAVQLLTEVTSAMFEGEGYAPYNEANAVNKANCAEWLVELSTRVAALEAESSNVEYAMTAVETSHEAVQGIGSNLKYSAAEGGDQNAVYFPRTSSNRSTSHCYNNSITWFETYEGQGKVYVSVIAPYADMRIFINGHEVDTSAMLNTTGVFEIDCSEYTVNGRNLFQITDTGYGAARSTILFLAHNPEVIEGEAADVGVDEAVFGTIDAIVANDVEYGFTSAQLAVVKDGVLIHTNAWGAANSYYSDGTRITEDDPNYVAVTDETLYDLASNSKMYSVNYALQKLISDGKLSLNTKIVDIFPEFAMSIYKEGTTTAQIKQIREWKSALTIQNILEHQAGFDPDPQYHNDQFNQITQKPEQGVDNELFSQDRETTRYMVLRTPLVYEPGTKTVYSDVDYMLLCFVIEEVTGMGIQEYLKQTFWDPMGLTHITYNPLDNGFTKEQTAATELNGNSRDGVIDFINIREGVIQGTVHDEKCYYAMGGISGHAGLYANATTLATLAQVMQNYNGYGTTRLAGYEVNSFFTGRKDSAANWGLGWWREGDYQRPWYFGAQSPSTTVGHQGWTGTLSSIDTDNNLTTVYLTNKINSPVTDNLSNANKFDGNWYTSSSLGFVPTILYMGMEEFNAADDVQAALDALLIDMAVIKMNRVVGNGTTDITHPNLLSAYSIMEAAVEAVEERPTEENIESLVLALESMTRKYKPNEMADLVDRVEDLAGDLDVNRMWAKYSLPFTDLVEGAYYYDAAINAYLDGIIAGITETTFVPEGKLTRAQVVTMLWRAAGCPAPTSTEHPFTDVEEGRFYYEAMLWAVENGITSGTSATTFSPDTAANRGQVVTFLWRAQDEPVPTTEENPFLDVKEGRFYYDAVLWAVENGITVGMSTNHFGVETTCQRGHMVTFLDRLN